MIQRPMLACSDNITIDQLSSLTYPVYCSEKLDGIRAVIQIHQKKLQLMSRSMKLIPNCHLQEWCEDHGLSDLDGEIILPGASFHEIQSWVMTNYPLPRAFEYHVFDHISTTGEGYLQRLQKARARIDMYAPPYVKLLEPIRCDTPDHVARYFDHVSLEEGEGIIIRSPQGFYKQGRSTLREQIILKMKTFEDAEAEIIGFEEALENLNPQTICETGYARRSGHKINLRGKETLGALVVRNLSDKEEFRIGSGFDDKFKAEIWMNRPYYLGQIVTYKHQPHGKKEKPRTPIFKGIRRD